VTTDDVGPCSGIEPPCGFYAVCTHQKGVTRHRARAWVAEAQPPGGRRALFVVGLPLGGPDSPAERSPGRVSQVVTPL
jgi:hypothetical protein